MGKPIPLLPFSRYARLAFLPHQCHVSASTSVKQLNCSDCMQCPLHNAVAAVLECSTDSWQLDSIWLLAAGQMIRSYQWCTVWVACDHRMMPWQLSRSKAGPAVQEKVVPTLMANYAVWPLAHALNFRYFPLCSVPCKHPMDRPCDGKLAGVGSFAMPLFSSKCHAAYAYATASAMLLMLTASIACFVWTMWLSNVSD